MQRSGYEEMNTEDLMVYKIPSYYAAYYVFNDTNGYFRFIW